MKILPNFMTLNKKEYVYDAFISHAVEDKIPIANELYELLKSKGLKVWYSGTELGVGDKVTDSIKANLEKCRFGIAIISPTYLTKIWAQAEFFMLLSREKEGQKIILPVLYNITAEELASKSALMADIFAVPATKGLDHVASVLVNEIGKHRELESKNLSGKIKPKIGWWAALLIPVLILMGYAFFQYNNSPNQEVIEKSIENRITTIQASANIDWQQITQIANVKPATVEDIKKIYANFTNIKSYYRNEYTLNTGRTTIRAKKNVEAALNLEMETMSPLNGFNLHSPNVFRADSLGTTGQLGKYAYYNTQPVKYTITTTENSEGLYKVKVTYTNTVRLIILDLVFPPTTNDIKRYQLTLTALLPIETYFFEQQKEGWIVSHIE